MGRKQVGALLQVIVNGDIGSNSIMFSNLARIGIAFVHQKKFLVEHISKA
jgi:hypothetical protein